MKKLMILTSLFGVLLISCKSEKSAATQSEYLRWVGDIEPDPTQDNPSFQVCHGEEQILQYFNLGHGPLYSSEKPALLNAFNTNYTHQHNVKQSGMIRIRFVVNCKGKAGRFRVLQADTNYQEFEFDRNIVNKLLDITRNIKNWPIQIRHETPVDYYMYLIFKIQDGQLTEILP